MEEVNPLVEALFQLKKGKDLDNDQLLLVALAILPPLQSPLSSVIVFGIYIEPTETMPHKREFLNLVAFNTAKDVYETQDGPKEVFQTACTKFLNFIQKCHLEPLPL